MSIDVPSPGVPAVYRKIIHVDMDAFYAAVEQRDYPALRGRPVIVGGDPEKRGVVSTCSYEARRFGIHSAMPTRTAKKLCPDAVFVRPRFAVYESVSAQIREIFHAYTPLVEPLSLDEAFLDVSHQVGEWVSAAVLAGRIRKAIHTATGLTASAGISYNKFLAKVASDINKPDGLYMIRPEEAEAFLEALDIKRFFGIGRVTEHKMRSMGIHRGSDLKRLSLEELGRHFGKAGIAYFYIVRGVDDRPVEPDRGRKSAGKETTFEVDLVDRDAMLAVLKELSSRVHAMLQEGGHQGTTITLKVKFADFSQITRSRTVGEPPPDPAALFAVAAALFHGTDAGARPVRLLGVSVSGFEEEGPAQLMLPF